MCSHLFVACSASILIIFALGVAWHDALEMWAAAAGVCVHFTCFSFVVKFTFFLVESLHFPGHVFWTRLLFVVLKSTVNTIRINWKLMRMEIIDTIQLRGDCYVCVWLFKPLLHSSLYALYSINAHANTMRSPMNFMNIMRIYAWNGAGNESLPPTQHQHSLQFHLREKQKKIRHSRICASEVACKW